MNFIQYIQPCRYNVFADQRYLNQHLITIKHLTFEFKEKQHMRKIKQELNKFEQEQIKALTQFERQKKKEDTRVEKRGLPKHIVNIILEHTQHTCLICLDDLNQSNVFMTKCGHVMYKGCERKMVENNQTNCPSCRAVF